MYNRTQQCKWGKSKFIACKRLNNFTLNYLRAGKKKAPAVSVITNYTSPQGTQDLRHFNNPFYDSFSEENIPSQLCLLLGAIYRTTLASAEWTTDANLLAVLECPPDLLTCSSAKGGLLTFSASTYVTSSSMSVDGAPLKKFQCQKSCSGTGCCSHVARGSCSTPYPFTHPGPKPTFLVYTLDVVNEVCTRGEKKNIWLKFSCNSFSNSALFCSFCILLISGSIYFTLLDWHFFPRMIIEVGWGGRNTDFTL